MTSISAICQGALHLLTHEELCANFGCRDPHHRDNEISDVIGVTFTTIEERFGEMVTIELKPGGASIPVTEENKKD